MFGQQPLGLKVDETGYGFIKRESIGLKNHRSLDCAFRKDGYNSLHIYPMHILSIRAQSS